MNKHKLVEKLDDGAEIPFSYDEFDVEYRYRNVMNMPTLNWPNSVPCVEANLYLLSGVMNKSWSIKHDGGTAKANASILSHIIRFCFNNGIHFCELTDAYFSIFINVLMLEKKKDGTRYRSNTRVVEIGRHTLRFLMFVGQKHYEKYFIGEKGCRLTCFELEYKEGNVTRKYYHHISLPSKDPYVRRLPVALADVSKLNKLVTDGSSKSLIERDSCLIKAFDATGGRRSEVANLRVPDVQKAISSDEKVPMLRLITLKQKGHEDLEDEREVPVFRTTLRAIKKYIERTRKRIIKKINKRRMENGDTNIIKHDFVFISETTGMPLGANSITTMFNNWAKAIGARGDLIAHAFRHSYITKVIDMLIKEFELKEESELKAKFATDKVFKLKLLSWTGHKSLKSLDNYIHLAFDDLLGINETMDKAMVLSSVNSAQNEIIELRQKIANGKINASELIDEMDHLLGDLEEVLQA